MKPATIAPIPWGALRVEYARTYWVSLRAFAEQHDLPYKSLCRRAKREGWRRLRSLSWARQRVRECEAQLDFARKVATAAGRYVGRLAAAALPLEKLAVDAYAASFAVSNVWTAALHLYEARHELAEVQAGRDRGAAWGSPFSVAKRALHDWKPESAWPRFDFTAYRERGPGGAAPSCQRPVLPARAGAPAGRGGRGPAPRLPPLLSLRERGRARGTEVVGLSARG